MPTCPDAAGANPAGRWKPSRRVHQIAPRARETGMDGKTAHREGQERSDHQDPSDAASRRRPQVVESGEWQVPARPYATAAGKSVEFRFQRVDNPNRQATRRGGPREPVT